jgi:hypothetical protein
MIADRAICKYIAWERSDRCPSYWSVGNHLTSAFVLELVVVDLQDQRPFFHDLLANAELRRTCQARLGTLRKITNLGAADA